MDPIKIMGAGPAGLPAAITLARTLAYVCGIIRHPSEGDWLH